tara:strand:- start:508 stop:717 length:210 start_codon:yes stop_codon:yes gene_type:complete
MKYQDLTPDEYRILSEALKAYSESLKEELARWGATSSVMSGEEVEIQTDIEDIDSILEHVKYETLVIKE